MEPYDPKKSRTKTKSSASAGQVPLPKRAAKRNSPTSPQVSEAKGPTEAFNLRSVAIKHGIDFGKAVSENIRQITEHQFDAKVAIDSKAMDVTGKLAEGASDATKQAAMDSIERIRLDAHRGYDKTADAGRNATIDWGKMVLWAIGILATGVAFYYASKNQSSDGQIA